MYNMNSFYYYFGFFTCIVLVYDLISYLLCLTGSFALPIGWWVVSKQTRL